MNSAEARPQRGGARDALLLATLEVIASHGVDGVTHRRVAEIAGVSPGSATYHFSSREDLIRGAFTYYMDSGDRALHTLEAGLRPTNPSPKERVRELISGLVGEAFAYEGFVRAEYEMILFASVDDALAAELRRRETRWIGHLAADLEEAGAHRAVETARILINLTRGFDIERLANPNLDLEVLRQRLDVVLDALIP